MKIEKVQKDDLLTVSLDGRLDTLTAPELAKELNESLPKAQKLTLDFKNLEYISSSGLLGALYLLHIEHLALQR